ncbi:MAG: hypothetical protein IJV14_02250 [Lachnospiraceae bacterium]|nr:hypothetical protein [Lachnospiraceae bacterium]
MERRLWIPSRHFGIQRDPYYRWVSRLLSAGLQGLLQEDHRPCPRKTARHDGLL